MNVSTSQTLTVGQIAVMRDALVRGSYLPDRPRNRTDCKVLVRRGFLESTGLMYRPAANAYTHLRLTSTTIDAVTDASRRLSRTGRRVTEEERELWRDVPGFHGEDYLEVDPEGRVWYLNPDEPAWGVDVSHVPLEYCEYTPSL